tara:strand:+ start:166 stop:339 length:174 start_codon:yes stop_codon:yes gene_type:complete
MIDIKNDTKEDSLCYNHNTRRLDYTSAVLLNKMQRLYREGMIDEANEIYNFLKKENK